MRNIFPPEIVIDFDTFVVGSGIPRMNGDGCLPEGTYHVCIKGLTFPFRDVELAPPGGVIGQNYSRCALLRENTQTNYNLLSFQPHSLRISTS